MPTPIRSFQSMIAMDSQVSIKKILGDSLDPIIVGARGAAMWLAHEAGHDLVAIGEAFGCGPVLVQDYLSLVERTISEDSHFAGWMACYEFVLSMPAEDG